MLSNQEMKILYERGMFNSIEWHEKRIKEAEIKLQKIKNEMMELNKEQTPTLLRVRYYHPGTEETSGGTVIDEKTNYYVVIPDENLQLTQKWDKIRCDLLR